MSTPEEMIKALEDLERLDEVAIKDIAQDVKRVLDANISKGVDPYGVPLKKTQDGKKPLVNAAASITVTAVGPNAVIIRQRGNEARHTLGLARGQIVRATIPNKAGELPATIAAAVETQLVKAFEKIMGGK